MRRHVHVVNPYLRLCDVTCTLLILTFLLIMADRVYKNGFSAELIGRIITAVQAYTSLGITWSVSARTPEIVYKQDRPKYGGSSDYTLFALKGFEIVLIINGPRSIQNLGLESN